MQQRTRAWMQSLNSNTRSCYSSIMKTIAVISINTLFQVLLVSKELHRSSTTKMNIFFLIVGLSRVRSSADFRIMPLRGNTKEELQYLKELRIPAELKMWMKGINPVTHKFDFVPSDVNKEAVRKIDWTRTSHSKAKTVL